MHDCTHLSRFALVSGGFPKRNAKKYTGYCIIACVSMWNTRPILRTVTFYLQYRPPQQEMLSTKELATQSYAE